MSQGRTNVAPKNIPWDMLCVLITEMYGGKIDNAGDFQILNKLVTNFMTPAAFEDECDIVDGIQSSETESQHRGHLILPGGTGWREFMEWVNALPEREPPTYLGLPANAEKLLLVGQAEEMVENLRQMMQLLDEGEQLMAEIAEA